MRRTKLTLSDILAWADAHQQQHGQLPNLNSGTIPGTAEDWYNLDHCLRQGRRGLGPGSSLAKLLALQRGYRNRKAQPRLTEQQLLKWADAWKRRHGTYPKRNSGSIPGPNGEAWHRVNDALVRGLRGLPGGSSLARFLAKHRQVRNDKALPRLTVTQILAWADAWQKRTGAWPKDRSGPIPELPGQTWTGVDIALRQGQRGLPGGSSLARLLAKQRGVKNEKALPQLTENGIWAWMVSHFNRTGQWPTPRSGRILGTRFETWRAVNQSLQRGRRGLPGGSSVQQLLTQRLGQLTAAAAGD